MKKWAGLLAALLLTLGATAGAAVQIGDKAADFTIVNSDNNPAAISLDVMNVPQCQALHIFIIPVLLQLCGA
mgnify:CR=1 FL=1